MSVSQNSVLLSEKKGNRAEKAGTVCCHAAGEPVLFTGTALLRLSKARFKPSAEVAFEL